MPGGGFTGTTVLVDQQFASDVNVHVVTSFGFSFVIFGVMFTMFGVIAIDDFWWRPSSEGSMVGRPQSVLMHQIFVVHLKLLTSSFDIVSRICGLIAIFRGRTAICICAQMWRIGVFFLFSGLFDVSRVVAKPAMFPNRRDTRTAS